MKDCGVDALRHGIVPIFYLLSVLYIYMLFIANYKQLIMNLFQCLLLLYRLLLYIFFPFFRCSQVEPQNSILLSVGW